MKLSRTYLCLLFFLISVSGFAQKEILILHTNDLNSQTAPLKRNGLGGMLRLAAIVEQEKEKQLNLFDAGGFWTGMPYFNFLEGGSK